MKIEEYFHVRSDSFRNGEWSRSTLFSRGLYKLRIDSGMSQVGAAMALGVSQAQMSRIESGVCIPNVEQVLTLCVAYGVEVREAFKRFVL